MYRSFVKYLFFFKFNNYCAFFKIDQTNGSPIVLAQEMKTKKYISKIVNLTCIFKYSRFRPLSRDQKVPF